MPAKSCATSSKPPVGYVYSSGRMLGIIPTAYRDTDAEAVGGLREGEQLAGGLVGGHGDSPLAWRIATPVRPHPVWHVFGTAFAGCLENML